MLILTIQSLTIIPMISGVEIDEDQPHEKSRLSVLSLLQLGSQLLSLASGQRLRGGQGSGMLCVGRKGGFRGPDWGLMSWGSCWQANYRGTFCVLGWGGGYVFGFL